MRRELARERGSGARLVLICGWALLSGWTMLNSWTGGPGLAEAAEPPVRKLRPQEKQQAAQKLVAQALSSEATEASSSMRQQLLQAALEQAPDFAPAHWNLGEVQLNHRWVSIAEAPQVAGANLRLIAYRKLRERTTNDLVGQQSLARHCREKGLTDEARAHWTRVLALDADHEEARAELGFRRINGTWLTQQELDAAAPRLKAATQSLARWKGKLEAIRDGLASESAARQATAREKLRSVSDPAAIVPLEVILATHSVRPALAAVETLGQIAGEDATLALARQAVHSPWDEVRRDAAHRLAHRPRETYVPVLLSALYTPLQVHSQLDRIEPGRTLFRQVFYREGQNKKELAVFETQYVQEAGAGALDAQQQAVAHRQAMLAQRAALATQQQQQTEAQNERICDALAVATNAPVSPSPENWWDWWNKENELFLDEKELVQSYAREEVTLYDRSSGSQGSGSGGGSSGGGYPMDCLAAGTLVWTITGPQPIESIVLGDRVLSQDPISGELAYKPVLRTTVRPSSKLVKISLGEETVESSGGHLFWVAGQGWIRARKMQPAALLHGVAGSVRVETVAEGATAPTYNLVVADFHSYFVGRSQLLSHDNTLHRAAPVTVPGLPAQGR